MSGYTLSALGNSSASAKAFVAEELSPIQSPSAATQCEISGLALVERAFRCLKTVDLQVRPVYHWLADRVRAHVLLCMLAYYLEWHMRQRLAPVLFEDPDKHAAETLRTSVVGAGAAFTGCRAETDHEIVPRWSAGAQLPDPARRSRNHRSKHHRHGDIPKLSAHHSHQADPHPAQSIPAARAQFVASSAGFPRIDQESNPTACTISIWEVGIKQAPWRTSTVR
jgi:hypothetical protein